MNDQTQIAEDVLDARPGGMPDPLPTSSADITVSLDKVKGEIAAFDKINAGLAKLQKQHPSDLVVDVTTPAGMKVAIAARAAWRDPRVALERARKSAKAPVLELGRSIDKFAAGIEEQLRVGELNYDAQIKVETDRKAREKKEQEEREAARVQQIQGKIAFLFSTRPARVFGKPASVIAEALAGVEGQEIAEAVFAELTQQAITAKEEAAAELRRMHVAQTAHEAESERQRTQAEENARKQAELRKQQEDFEAEQRAHRAQVAQELAERQAKEEAERRERAAELAAIQKAKDDLAAGQRAEADRLAAIERKRLDDEAAVERTRLEHVAAHKRELQRLADEAERVKAQAKRDEEEAERKKADAAAARKLKKLQKLAGMAPRLLSLLVDIVPHLSVGGDLYNRAQALIEEADAA